MPVGYYKRSPEQIAFLREISHRPRYTRILKDKICSVCGNTFRPKDSFQKHCSASCSFKDRPKKGVFRKCKICEKEFYVLPTFITSAKYCSRRCQYKGQEIPQSKLKLICKNCGKDYLRPRSSLRGRNSQFCTLKCFKQFKKTKFYETKKGKHTLEAKLKKQLWQVFSEYIRQRDSGVCISCGKKDFWRKMDAGHYIPKTAGLSLYFDERNVNCQCTHCNRWLHGNLSRYAVELRKKYGENILEELDTKRHQTKIITYEEYKELIERYKTKLSKLFVKLSYPEV